MPDVIVIEDGLSVAARLERLTTVPAQLHGATDVGDLFRRGATLARRQLGFARAAVLTVDRGWLSAETSDPLDDPESDRLRRRMQESPLAITPGTAEAEAARSGRSRPGSQSLLAEQLGLAHYGFVSVTAQGVTLGLLVVDRDAPALDAVDYAAVATFAGIFSSVLETALVRARLDEVATELRHLAVSTQALLGEVQHAPPALPSRHGDRLSFGTFEGVPVVAASAEDNLTSRERVVAGLLAEGLSNRQIAERLVVSPETVKAHVASILRKLGAANRVEAVARFLQTRKD